MIKVSVLEFRRKARLIIRRLEQGHRMVLTYRGKPVARMEPIAHELIGEDDPIYSLGDLAVDELPSLSNEEIDRDVYRP